MKVEVLYFSGCPNYSPAVARVREALERERVPAEMVEVEIKDPAMALSVHFLGSPSIRIDGLDVEPSARSAQTFLARLQPWFVGLAVILLGVGVFQLYRRNSCQRRSRLSLILLALSAIVIVAVLAFPQIVAEMMADYL